jgi:intracellular septation protein
MLLRAFGLLLVDLASTLVFLAVVLLTGNVPLAILAGMVFGASQIGLQLALKQPVGTMQWLSFVLVIGLGAVSLIANDPRFVMIKPSLIYIIVGVVMLKRGWLNRYLPPIAMEMVPDVAVIFGFVWSGLMFFSAALNVAVALNFSAESWAAFMSIYGIVSKVALLLIGYGTMRFVGVRRRRAQLARTAAAQAGTA